jgi:sugar phosphate isomerase/epimerase
MTRREAMLRGVISIRRFLPFAAIAAVLFATPLFAQSPPADIFERGNLVAWCIVPFDAKKRGPEERAQMLVRLGLRRLAYDYRAEHVPAWDAELDALKRHGIELTAWWFPGSLNEEAKQALELFRRHGVKPQLWITGGGAPAKDAADQAARIEAEAQRVRSIAEAAAPLGCAVALYNHGGWFGEPENQVAIIERLRRDGITNVGIVYNFHHGHQDIARFAELWRKMQPHLLAVNLNGMVRDGDAAGRKILPIGSGTEDVEMLRVIRASGWRGPVGIIDHRPETDSEETLRENLEGLERAAK